MTKCETREKLGFFENELTNNILSFWLPRCLDEANGGYLNCFDNAGKNLISKDKYVWSQGRFIWMFSKLASMETGTFTTEQKKQFFDFASNGASFLKEHCLLPGEDVRCAFLLDEKGNAKEVEPGKPLDMSIYADCFAILGFAKYSVVSQDTAYYAFAKKIFQSVEERLKTNAFNTLPYPLSPQYKSHGIPMILSNVTKELIEAAEVFESSYIPLLKESLSAYTNEILDNFISEDNVIHEIVSVDNVFIEGFIGQIVNPGHTLEDMWFMTDTNAILSNSEPMKAKIAKIAKKAFEIGWDHEMGGLLHYCSPTGGKPTGELQGVEGEPMVQQALGGWGDKLWWVHSESLYTSLLCYEMTKDASFLEWHEKICDYTFSHFPNPDRDIREWIQILQRDGKPQDKVVALPVKDPFHITRNLIQIIELLHGKLQG